MEPIRVAVRRGGIVESRPPRARGRGADGRRRWSRPATPARHASLRSSSKPIQALPLARARPDLDERELAIASASHVGSARAGRGRARPARPKAPAERGARVRGPGRPPAAAVYHNCSGKHAGMLAALPSSRLAGRGLPAARSTRCSRRCWPSTPRPPRSHRAEVADRAPTAAGSSRFALPLERMARAFSRLEALEGGERVAAAMRAHPELIGGAGSVRHRADARAAGLGREGGARRAWCAPPDLAGSGSRVKVEDGNSRPLRPALAAFWRRLGLDAPDARREVPVLNSRGRSAAGTVAAL